MIQLKRKKEKMRAKEVSLYCNSDMQLMINKWPLWSRQCQCSICGFTNDRCEAYVHK